MRRPAAVPARGRPGRGSSAPRTSATTGYSDVGAVAGATAPAPLRAVREALPHAFLLVPGFGAQGAGADALAGVAAGDAAGFVVNASRSIIFAWRERGGDYRRAAAAAAESMRSDLQDCL